jgi:RNA-binding protein YhbY
VSLGCQSRLLIVDQALTRTLLIKIEEMVQTIENSTTSMHEELVRLTETLRIKEIGIFARSYEAGKFLMMN